MLKKALHFYEDPSQAPKVLLDCKAKIQAADAFIVITAEYNTGMPPALSNMLNHFGPKSFSYKPSGIISYSVGKHDRYFIIFDLYTTQINLVMGYLMGLFVCF